MRPFITKNISNPWGQYELNQWEANGSQRDKVIYNRQINARFIAEDKNTYSACIKVKGGDYKNFWLVPVTRTSFLFIAYVPQLEILNELAKIEVVKRILPKFPFLYSIYTKQDNTDGYKIDEETRIGCGAIILKVEESLDDFIFPWRGCIDNEGIISSYAKLNAIYSKIITQIEKLFKIAEDVNQREIEAIEAKQKQILKKTLIKTGVKLVALCVAPYAVAAIEGVDLLVDGIDMLDMDISDFSYADFDDNLLDLGEGFDDYSSSSDFLLDNNDYSSDIGDSSDSGYNVSFQGSDTTPVFDTHKDVTIVSDTGANHGSFDVYSKDNKEYIKFHSGSSADWSNWECIENGYFWHLGVKYSIKK